MNEPNFKNIVSESVKKAVIYCGTQVRLAERAGITQGAIGKYIRKDALPTGITAKKLAKAVDYTQPESDFAPHIFGDFNKSDNAA